MAPMNPRTLRPYKRKPGRPTIVTAVEAWPLAWIPPVSDGGAKILSYRIYLNRLLVDTVPGTDLQWVDSPSAGQVCEVSAVNSAGEGPRSLPVVATV